MISLNEQPSGPEKKPEQKSVAGIHCPPGDTSNQFFVGAVGGKDMITIVSLRCQMTKAQAINLAAWLIVLADPAGEEFERVVNEIKKT